MESIGEVVEITQKAAALAKAKNMVVVVTGKIDIITDGDRTKELSVGHEIMGRVVGTGCMAGSVLGSFAAVSDDLFDGCVRAMTHYGETGEKVAKHTNSPLEWKMKFIDELAK